MPNQPKVSIIMPCYNAMTHLPESVGSVLAQSFHNFELITIDDGSNDDTFTWLKHHADPRLHAHSNSNQGVSVARNIGLGLARGEYVAFLDADDTWNRFFIEKMLNHLSKHPQANLAYCGWQNIGLTGGRGNPYIPPDYEAIGKIEKLLIACPWPIHAALTRTEAIRAAGGFDDRYRNSEDYALWLRIASFHKIVRVPEVLAYYHHHSNQQASRNQIRAAKDTWLVQQRFLADHPQVYKFIDKRHAREITCQSLMKRGYDCYWKRNLKSSRKIFRLALRYGCAGIKDWKYILLSLLPLAWHKKLVRIADARAKQP